MSSSIARLSPPAPVGICILRTADGVNILSNELAHTYLNMLTHEGPPTTDANYLWAAGQFC